MLVTGTSPFVTIQLTGTDTKFASLSPLLFIEKQVVRDLFLPNYVVRLPSFLFGGVGVGEGCNLHHNSSRRVGDLNAATDLHLARWFCSPGVYYDSSYVTSPFRGGPLLDKACSFKVNVYPHMLASVSRRLETKIRCRSSSIHW